MNEFLAKAKQRPELARVTSTFNASSQQLLVNVDRDKAETLGVPIEEVYSAMQTMFGSLYVSQFNRSSRLWQVILQAEPSYRLTPRGSRPDLRARQDRQHGAAQGRRDHQVRDRSGSGDALQQLPGGQDHGQRGAGLQLGAGARRAGGDRRRGDAGRLRPRLERRGLRGEDRPAARRGSCSCSA